MGPELRQETHPQAARERGQTKPLRVNGPLVLVEEPFELWEVAVAPVETALLHNDSADRRSVACQVRRGAVADDIHPKIERLQQVGRRKRRVHDERNPVLVGDPGDTLDVYNGGARGSRVPRRRQPWSSR
jgi:hypothetical protein